MLEIKNLCVSVDHVPILKGLNLKVNPGRSMQLWAPMALGSRHFQKHCRAPLL